jgi:hypothetical protein
VEDNEQWVKLSTQITQAQVKLNLEGPSEQFTYQGLEKLKNRLAQNRVERLNKAEALVRETRQKLNAAMRMREGHQVVVAWAGSESHGRMKLQTVQHRASRGQEGFAGHRWALVRTVKCPKSAAALREVEHQLTGGEPTPGFPRYIDQLDRPSMTLLQMVSEGIVFAPPKTATPKKTSKKTAKAKAKAATPKAKAATPKATTPKAKAATRRRSRAEVIEIMLELVEASRRSGGVSRDQYHEIVGNTRDFVPCGWSPSATNAYVGCARRQSITVEFRKGETRADDALILTPAAKNAAK